MCWEQLMGVKFPSLHLLGIRLNILVEREFFGIASRGCKCTMQIWGLRFWVGWLHTWLDFILTMIFFGEEDHERNIFNL